MTTDEERLIEAVRKRLAHLGLHSHLYNNGHVARELVRSLRDGDGITMTPPTAPEPTYTLTFTTPLFDTLRALVETSKHRTPEEGELLDQLSILLADATPDKDANGKS